LVKPGQLTIAFPHKILAYKSQAAMIWPFDLVNTSLFYALHDHSRTDPAESNGWKISRYRYFFYVFVGSFVWYWFPGWITQCLSVFAWITWIKPHNVVVNQLFGGVTGLSLLPMTLDWTYIAGYIFSPLVAPWYAIANTLIGLILFYWFTAIGIHYSGHWWNAYLPMSDSNSYDNTGSIYNVTKILTPKYTFDEAKYKAYSPLFLSTTFSIAYGLSFAGISAVIVHTALFHGKEIYHRFKASRADEEDIHTRLMRKYPEAPDWWYGILLVVMIGFSFATIYAYPTYLAWWALIIALLISLIWSVPIGMIYAFTNVEIGLNVFTGMLLGPWISLMSVLKSHQNLSLATCNPVSLRQ
jgi:OPT family small oligopeptide transporter